jgi:polyhydroxybutyrate depolymerase
MRPPGLPDQPNRRRWLWAGLALMVAAAVTGLALPVWQAGASHHLAHPAGSSHLPTSLLRVADPTGTARPEPGRPGHPGQLATPASWVSTVEHIWSGGRSRSFVLSRPVGPGPLALLVVLHGREMTPATIARIADFPAVAGRAVLVYPAGFDLSWNAGACCGGAHAAGVDDQAFLAAVVHQVLATVPGTSTHDVYLAGFSNGGRMAYRMACTEPGLFAGVAAVEAVPVTTCNHPRPISIAIVAYRDDPLLSFSASQPAKVIEGVTEPRVDAVVAQWRRIDGCVGAAVVRQEGTATISTWAACRAGTRVQYELYAGGAHRWPRGGPTTPSATKTVWSFLSSYAPPRRRHPAGPARRPSRRRARGGRSRPRRRYARRSVR